MRAGFAPWVRAADGAGAASPSGLASATATDVGAVRRVNEDACIARPEIGLWAVADGMGGHQAGDLASQTIIAHLAAIAGSATEAAVSAAILTANEVLGDEAQRRGGGAIIGATVVALMADADRFTCLWAGDSRLYRLRNGAMIQLTRDHSQVQDMVESGLIPASAAETHPLANVITRAVGTGADLRLDRIADAVQPGDLFLICTDGLSKMVPDRDIAAILGAHPLGDQPAALVAAALAAGGRDNVTVVVVRATSS